MLCLDESTPVIMALSLLGAVLLIVGGSLWGSGDAASKYSQTVAGIALFSVSLVLLGLAGLGIWCNQCFCTPERKSRIAQRFYGRGGKKKPDGSSSGADEADADCGSLGSSFRSFRSSRRSVRGANSARRDRVMPMVEQQTPAAGSSPVAAIQEQPESGAAMQNSDEASGPAHSIPQTSIDDVPDAASSSSAAVVVEAVQQQQQQQQQQLQQDSVFASC